MRSRHVHTFGSVFFFLGLSFAHTLFLFCPTLLLLLGFVCQEAKSHRNSVRVFTFFVVAVLFLPRRQAEAQRRKKLQANYKHVLFFITRTTTPKKKKIMNSKIGPPRKHCSRGRKKKKKRPERKKKRNGSGLIVRTS